jgi:hypothetical protein
LSQNGYGTHYITLLPTTPHQKMADPDKDHFSVFEKCDQTKASHCKYEALALVFTKIFQIRNRIPKVATLGI